MRKLFAILSQAHWLATQADTLPKTAKELVLPTHGLIRIMNETLTYGYKILCAKWLFKYPATCQISKTVDTEAARSPKSFMPQKRCTSYSENRVTK